MLWHLSVHMAITGMRSEMRVDTNTITIVAFKFRCQCSKHWDSWLRQPGLLSLICIPIISLPGIQLGDLKRKITPNWPNPADKVFNWFANSDLLKIQLLGIQIGSLQTVTCCSCNSSSTCAFRKCGKSIGFWSCGVSFQSFRLGRKPDCKNGLYLYRRVGSTERLRSHPPI